MPALDENLFCTDVNSEWLLLQTAIKKNNPKKYLRSVGDGETVEFDVVSGSKVRNFFRFFIVIALLHICSLVHLLARYHIVAQVAGTRELRRREDYGSWEKRKQEVRFPRWWKLGGEANIFQHCRKSTKRWEQPWKGQKHGVHGAGHSDPTPPLHRVFPDAQNNVHP